MHQGKRLRAEDDDDKLCNASSRRRSKSPRLGRRHEGDFKGPTGKDADLIPQPSAETMRHVSQIPSPDTSGKVEEQMSTSKKDTSQCPNLKAGSAHGLDFEELCRLYDANAWRCK